MQKVFKYEKLYYINENELDNLIIRDNKLYYKEKCYKCNGTGHISYFDYYADGVCFECNGTGHKYIHIKTYKTLKGAERATQRKIQKEQEYKKQQEIQKKEVLNELKTIYVVNPKEDTKTIQEYLKDIGCIWSGKVWYKNNTKELENIQIIKIDITKE